MNWLIALAISLSIGGATCGPIGAVLVKSYRDERRKIERGSDPNRLPRQEEVFEEESSPKKHQGLLPQPAVVESPTDSIRRASDRRPRNPDELKAALRHNCPALLRLIKSHPIRCVGVQRSGKTTLVKKLCLLRLILLAGHRVIASTPHHEPTNSYPDCFQVVGIRNGEKDYSSIKQEWAALAERVHLGKINSITTVWDEFGLMDQVLEEGEITSILTSTLRETLKFGEYPVFILHGETTAFMPGSKGLVTVLLNSTVRIETVGEKALDNDGLETTQPTGKFNIQWLDGSKESGQIPGWLTEDYLLSLLPVNQSVYASNSSEELEGNEEAIASRLPAQFRISDTLAEPLKALYIYCKKKDNRLTVRDISRATLPELKGKSTKQIRQLLGILADKNLGEIEEENLSDSAVGFKAH